MLPSVIENHFNEALFQLVPNNTNKAHGVKELCT